jgi:PAS domain S-box-containing protein
MSDARFAEPRRVSKHKGGEHGNLPPQKIPTVRTAIKITLVYAVVSTLWILCSGWVVHHFVRDLEWVAWLEDIKGWFFVLVTAGLLGVVLLRSFRTIERSAQALADSDTQVRLISDNLADSYVFQYGLDAAGKPYFTHVSAGVERVHGVKPEDAVRNASQLLSLVVPEQRAMLTAAEAISARDLTDFDLEVWMQRPDGSRQLIHLRSRPRRDANGNVLWNGTATDITQRRQEELARAEISERYHSLFANALNGIAYCQMIFDEGGQPVDFVYLDVNPAFEKLTGLKNVAGRRVSEVVPGICETDPKLIENYSRVAVTGMAARFEQYVAALNDWYSISVYSPAKGQFVSVFEVITERKQSEIALRQSEALLQEMGRAANIGGWDLDVATGKANWTEEVARIHDLEPDAQPSKEMGIAFYHGESRKQIEAAVQAAIEQGTPYDLELEIVSAKGVHKWIHTKCQAVVANGKVVKLRGSFQDITPYKLAVMALHESGVRFRTMFELASIGMAQANPQTGQWLRVNQKFCEITGYSEAELLQKRGSEITHPDDRQTDWELFQRVVCGELNDYRLEKRYVRKDGSVAWVNVNMTVVRNDAGEPEHSMATIEDITARKETEAELFRLATAVEQSAESMVITDTRGKVLYVNPACEKATGYTREEIIGGNPSILKSGKHDQAFYRQMWGTLARGETWHGHFINRRKDGTLFEEDATISPIRDASGKIINYVAIKLDVTREVELAAQFRQSQKMEAIGQLAGGVAHDFNNILAAIMMQTQLVSMGDDISSDVQEGLDEIRASAQRAANLTRQLLLFSSRQVMQTRDLDLNEVVTSLVKMLQRMIREDISLQLNLHSIPLMTHADAGMLDQVLMNLAVNARDAMPAGGKLMITTSEENLDEAQARLHPDLSPGRYVCLTVADTGSGIPPEVMSRIFEPFFTTKEPGKGTGLGLATVFGIVKQHHGGITVESEPDRGTRFQVYLPATSISAPDAAAATHSPPRGGTETSLLVEDDRMLRVPTRILLGRAGYKVLEAANGIEAMQIWDEYAGSIHLLLTDIVMPEGMSGRELASHLLERNPRLRIVFTSGYSAEIAGRDLLLQPGQSFIQKPATSSQILELVRHTLDS